jgi:NAD(P)-dependent dehydrogenase (short-subunit alcohol dehydrogenase family)
MRVIVIGATGTIGRAAADTLAERHEVVRVGHSGGELQVDLESPASIQALFRAAAPFDAVVCCAGNATFKPLAELGDEGFALGLRSKLMGQVNVVRLGLAHVADGGSFTLTSGVLAREPMPGSAAISPVNAAVEAFARAAALELPRGLRVNVVSPPWVSETLETMGMDPAGGVPARKLAAAYVRCVEGTMNGETVDGRSFA